MKLVKKFLLLVFIFLAFGAGVFGIEKIGWFGGKGKTAEKKTESTEKISLKFAVMSDIHSDYTNLKKALEIAKTDDNSFVILTGDLTTIGKEEELLGVKKILDESEIKYYVVPGNHDVWYDRRTQKDLFGEVFGKTFTSFKEGNIKFILVNNGDYINGLEGLKGTEGQKKWLTEETKECLQITCLVFMHMPLNHPSSIYIMGQNSSAVATEAAQLVKLLVGNKVKQIFAGHLHYSSSYEFEGLRTTIVGAVTSDRNVQSPKFLEVSVSDGNFDQKEVFVAD